MSSTPMPDAERLTSGAETYQYPHQQPIAHYSDAQWQQPDGHYWQYQGAPGTGYPPQYGPGNPTNQPMNPYHIQPPSGGNETCLGCGSIGCFVVLILLLTIVVGVAGSIFFVFATGGF